PPEEKEVINEDLGDLESLVVSEPANYNSFEMPTKESSKTFDTNYMTSSVLYFGQKVNVKLDEQVKSIRLSLLSNEQIARAWDQAIEMDYEQTVFDLNRYKETFNINDYGYYLLVKSAVRELVTDRNLQNFLSWFYLLKSG